jgi:hypothetical protein
MLMKAHTSHQDNWLHTRLNCVLSKEYPHLICSSYKDCFLLNNSSMDQSNPSMRMLCHLHKFLHCRRLCRRCQNLNSIFGQRRSDIWCNMIYFGMFSMNLNRANTNYIASNDHQGMKNSMCY